ncbi:hypothetical protein EDB89DRAFT_1069638 [Lactarius sanguifluus]|nr:hypothetical protein EDB89DRAFT_1069638 [Lactarius sanguifluus]
MGTELFLSVGSPSLRPLSPPGDSSSGDTSHTRDIAQGDCEIQQNRSTQVESHPTTIAMLPDDVLLEIFDFYRKDHKYTLSLGWKWHLLAHVCQTWRQIVFASPYRLDLKILCTYGTPVRKNLGIWPAFPIIIRCNDRRAAISPNDADNIIFALEHRDRICDIGFSPGVPWNSWSEKFDAAWLEPFPVLTRLYIKSPSCYEPPVLPANFMGGSGPCLQVITLIGIPYPALPRLLLSASDLFSLDLLDIPPTGYVSPEAMVVSLATLPRLDCFTIGFRSPASSPHQMRPPPSRTIRTALPALTSFRFIGASGYLEDLVSRIDCPQITKIFIDYLWLADYQVTQLSKFIDRSIGPKLTLPRRADLLFYDHTVSFAVYPHVNPYPRHSDALVSFEGFHWRVLDIAQFLSHFPTLTNVVHLNLESDLAALSPRVEDMGDVDWHHLLHQFSTARTLRLCFEPAVRVPLALGDIPGELVAEVLPSLDFIYVVAQPASSIEKFIAARKLSGCPVTVVIREMEFYERLKSYAGKQTTRYPMVFCNLL